MTGCVADRDELEAMARRAGRDRLGLERRGAVCRGWRRAGAGDEFGDLAELAEALAGSLERHRETTLQGAAFLAAAAGWPHPVLGALPETCAYCVAVGAVAGAHGMPLADALAAYLQAFFANLVQAAIRLGVTGQTGAVATIAALEPLRAGGRRPRRAIHPRRSRLGELSSPTSWRCEHETQYSRLFRS